MVHFAAYGLQVTIIASAIFFYGCYLLVKISLEIDEKFKGGILFLLLSFIINTIIGFLHSSIFIDIDPNSLFWLSIPFLHLFGAIFLLIGARKFFVALEKS